MARIVSLLLALLLLAIGPAAHATFHLFQIEQIYSNADGSVQFVVLHEFAGANGENFWQGNRLTVTHAGVAKSITFGNNLPSNTANKRVLVATSGYQALGLAAPDFMIPDRFLPTDGGSLNYAGVDVVTFNALPTDGANAFYRGGRIDVNTATNFAGNASTVPAGPITNVEFFNQGLNHYFLSGLQPDIDALDTGRIAGWARTGLSFKAFPSQASGGAGVNPVCRFLIPPEHGNSHFFSASPAECATINAKIGVDPNYSGYIDETDAAFFIALPNTTTGACPAGTIPVYRLWNQRADSNHRYTTSVDVKNQMIAANYVAEGYGPDAVIMCAPS